MKKLFLFLLMILALMFSALSSEEKRQQLEIIDISGYYHSLIKEKSWQEDIDNDRQKEMITIYKFSAGGNMGLYLHIISIFKNGQEIFPLKSENSFFSREDYILEDIESRFLGKEIIIFNIQNPGIVVANYYSLREGRYVLYNCDRSDKKYAYGAKIDKDAAMREFRRGTKFQTAVRFAKKFLKALSKKQWAEAKRMLSGDYPAYDNLQDFRNLNIDLDPSTLQMDWTKWEHDDKNKYLFNVHISEFVIIISIQQNKISKIRGFMLSPKN